MATYRGKHTYLGAWKYFFLDILYAIPLIGFIFLLFHAFNHNHENRMHYARSYFVRFLMVLIVAAIIVLVSYLLMGSDAFTQQMHELIKVFEDSVNSAHLPTI